MNGELHQNSEAVGDLHLKMRDLICSELCPVLDRRHCKNWKCFEGFFIVAGQIEMKLEESEK
jgi:hypothetical protein